MDKVVSRPELREVRRRQLIGAAIASIAKRGLGRTTLAHVAGKARLSRGIVNFYFKSKDALLLAALNSISDEYRAWWKRAVAEAEPTPAARLDAMIEADFAPDVASGDRAFVWNTFRAEARGRRNYWKLLTDVDREFTDALAEQCAKLSPGAPAALSDPETVARALCAMMNGFWQDHSMNPAGFDCEQAKHACRVFLAGFYPDAIRPHIDARRPAGKAPQRPARRKAHGTANGTAAGLSAQSLPGWTYDDAGFFELEKSHIFAPAWHLVGHLSELAAPGDYATLDVVDERAIVIRGTDGELRAFHNVCPHRASRLVRDEAGNCPRALACPYHGWTFDFEGNLKAVPAEKAFAGLDRSRYGLKSIELEEWMGFVFVRFSGDGPPVAERMGAYAAELAPYRIAEMAPMSEPWRHSIDVDWKNVMDNYLEGYHIATGHPGLYRLFGSNYEVEVQGSGVGRAFSWLRDRRSSVWSEGLYQSLLPDVPELPERRRRAWVYYHIFPTTTIGVFPDQIAYFQMYPTGPGRTVYRARTYAHPDKSREMRAARFLNRRINALVQEEDELLVDWVQRGLRSSSYSTGLLSEKEICIRQFHDLVRDAVPAARSIERPPAGRVGEANRRLGKGRAAR